MFALTMKLENRKLMVDDHHSTVGGRDLFYSKVKFGNLGFSMGKSENSGFF